LPEVRVCMYILARVAARGARTRRVPAAGAAPTAHLAGGVPWDQGLATRAPAPPGLRRPRARVERSQGFGGPPRFRRDPKVLEEPQGFWRHLIDMLLLGGGGV